MKWCLQGISPTLGIVYWMLMDWPECCAVASLTDTHAKAIRLFDKKEEAEQAQAALRICGIVLTVHTVIPLPDRS